MLLSDLHDEATIDLEVRGCARSAGGADDDRDTCLDSRRDHDGEVTLDSCDIGKGYACAEVVGTRVAGSCIAGDHVRVALHALLKRLLGETVSQDR